MRTAAAALAHLARSEALWNRSHLDLRSGEILAQILDVGSVADWRALAALAREDPALRHRLLTVVRQVPLATGRFWLAALVWLGADAAVDEALPVAREAW